MLSIWYQNEWSFHIPWYINIGHLPMVLINFVYKSMSINIFKNTIVGVIVLIKSQVLLISFWHDYLVMILKKE